MTENTEIQWLSLIFLRVWVGVNLMSLFGRSFESSSIYRTEVSWSPRPIGNSVEKKWVANWQLPCRYAAQLIHGWLWSPRDSQFCPHDSISGLNECYHGLDAWKSTSWKVCSCPPSDYRRSENGCVIINNDNILSEIPQMRLGEGGCTQTLPPFLCGAERLFPKDPRLKDVIFEIGSRNTRVKKMWWK